MDDSLLELVVCPITHSKLKREVGGEGEFLVAEKGGVKYPVKEGLPVLLPEAAVVPAPFKTVEEFRAAMKG